MSIEILPDLEQRSDEWYEQRRGIVTASAVGSLITAKTLKTASNDYSRGLVAQLAAERITGESEPGYVNADMQRGIDHEPFARRAYAEHYAPVDEVGFVVRTFDGFKIGYSPDGFIGDDGLLEIKCPRAKSHISTLVNGTVPLSHMAQLQTGLLVSGRKWIDFVSFYGGLPLYVERVHPIDEWQAVILEAVTEAEAAIASTVNRYSQAITGRPTTERVPEFEEIRI